MRIGIDCRTILNPEAGEKAGVAHYTYHLVKSLLRINKVDEFILFFDHRAQNIVKDFLEPNTVIRFFTFSRYKKYLPFLYSHILSASAIADQKLDVFHSPANVVPMRYGGKFLVTIHDLAIYREPQVFPSRQGFSLKYLVPRSINRAQKIIAISDSTKKDIEEFFKVDPHKIDVIPLGVDHSRFTASASERCLSHELQLNYKIKKDYILFVGTLEPRKNLIRLIEAFYDLLVRKPDLRKRYQLVLAGHPGWLYEEIFEEVKNRHLEGLVVFPGYLPARDLTKLYMGSALFVYPSIYEGFGLPVLEAMAAGVPVITSDRSSLPEITGDAAVLVDPYDVEGMSRSMEMLLSDPQMAQELAAKGKERSQLFSWDKCARRTLETYRTFKV